MTVVLRILLFLFPVTIFCQELPPFTNFSPTLYNAGNQNWMLSQGENGNIYVANGNGLLEFTGAEWNLYPMPNNTIVRSVQAVGDLIFTGAYMEFGYWREKETGSLEYHSLNPKFPNPIQEGEQFWHIINIDGVILFHSYTSIYKYNIEHDKLSVVFTSENPVKTLFNVNGDVYFLISGKGLFTLKNGAPENVIPEEVLQGIDITYIFPTTQGLHLISRANGFFIWDGKKMADYNSELSEQLQGKSIFSALKLPHNSILLGTVEDGLYFVDAEGKIQYHFNQKNGLINNTVLSIFIDDNKNIWTGLDNGISVINLDSPYQIFQDHNGKIGSVYASFQSENALYLGTNQGLYYKRNNETEFNLIEGTNGQVWSLQEIDGMLLCGHNTGTFLVEEGKAIKIADRNGTWIIKKLKKNEDYYIQGHYDGISLLKREEGRLVEFPMISGFPFSSKSIVPEKDGDIWIGNEHRGVFRLRLNDALSEVTEKKNYTFPGITGITSSILKFNDTLYYSSVEKILQYNPEKDKFIGNSELARTLKTVKRSTGKIISENKNKIWGFGSNMIFNVILDDINSGYKKNSIYLSKELRNITRGYENLGDLGRGEYLLGGAGGYLKFNEALKANFTPEIRIDRVELAALDESPQLLSLLEEQPFHYKENNISFRYSVPEYNKFHTQEYSFRLVGLSPNWSQWGTVPVANFKNLSFGDYKFEVRGRVGSQVSAPVSYTFEIARPWYWSVPAMVCYFIILVIVFVFVHQIYKRKHKKVLVENERKLRMQNLEAEQIITKLQKEQLERDMLGKNKELAVSTMNLIRKNEFLSNIKDQLKKSGQSSEVNSVIKTIEKDISEKDNWNVFKEAFNNADKDFFKKIRKSHPDLTANDLKLCAYLRLNLSSKEIAPLLNISVKSVEIKRYRLRKKMDLDRKTSLSDYVFDF